jgi:hypothetical protein
MKDGRVAAVQHSDGFAHNLKYLEQFLFQKRSLPARLDDVDQITTCSAQMCQQKPNADHPFDSKRTGTILQKH